MPVSSHMTNSSCSNEVCSQCGVASVGGGCVNGSGDAKGDKAAVVNRYTNTCGVSDTWLITAVNSYAQCAREHLASLEDSLRTGAAEQLSREAGDLFREAVKAKLTADIPASISRVPSTSPATSTGASTSSQLQTSPNKDSKAKTFTIMYYHISHMFIILYIYIYLF